MLAVLAEGAFVLLDPTHDIVCVVCGVLGERKGDLKIALRGGGGGGGVTWTPAEGRGGGLEKWGSASGPLFCVRTDVGAKGTGTQNLARKSFFPPKIPPPRI